MNRSVKNLQIITLRFPYRPVYQYNTSILSPRAFLGLMQGMQCHNLFITHLNSYKRFIADYFKSYCNVRFDLHV